jgi:hypothetical protein
MQSLADASVQQVVIQRIRAISPNTPPHWGKMTANQMLCHLRDAYLSAFGEKQVSAMPTLPLRSLIRYLVLYFPTRWPKNVRTRPEVDQHIGGTPPVDFQSDQESLIAVLQRFVQYGDRFQTSSHPMFGRMSEQDWLRWGYLHADHHLRQFGA